jgi:hypothetical protein
MAASSLLSVICIWDRKEILSRRKSDGGSSGDRWVGLKGIVTGLEALLSMSF